MSFVHKVAEQYFQPREREEKTIGDRDFRHRTEKWGDPIAGKKLFDLRNEACERTNFGKIFQCEIRGTSRRRVRKVFPLKVHFSKLCGQIYYCFTDEDGFDRFCRMSRFGISLLRLEEILVCSLLKRCRRSHDFSKNIYASNENVNFITSLDYILRNKNENLEKHEKYHLKIMDT